MISLNGKPIAKGSISIADMERSDYPDFSNAFMEAADYEDGSSLTEDEILELEDKYPTLVSELCLERCFS